MTVLIFVLTLVAASVVVSLGVAAFFTDAGVYGALGHGRAMLGGLLICIACAFVLFAVMNPDPLPWPETTEAYLRRTLGITVFSSFVWLPIYLAVFTTLARRRNREQA
ncbi:hypothetical protein [Oceaniglobus ichthyenteri]|uniref:hypothetical protein n=1 Tax=Oceaniglobus ichthyenteri TaxID=2136177 RepID=UPI000D37C19D|nr:hypothetical protein [Oceaniglobus ichthyenteri]